MNEELKAAKKKLKELIWHDKRVTSIGIDACGIEVGVNTSDIEDLIPEEIDGIPITLVRNGPIELQ